jgi:DNA repair exonuclease SbcCD ATPase subunit
MKRGIGFAALVLGSVGLAGALAALIGIWVVRPSVLRSSAEILDAADDGLQIVEEKATRADQLLKKIRGTVDPIAGKILKLADKTERTPEQEKELKRIEEDLMQRLGQVDAIAEAAQTAVALLNKTARLTRSLRTPGSLRAGGSQPEGTSLDSSDSLSILAQKLSDLRESLAKVGDKAVQKDIVDNVVRVSGDASDALKSVDSKLQEVRQKGAEWRTEIAELRTAVPAWVNDAAIIGSVLLVWLGLGQLTLSRWSWGRIGARRPD